MTYARIKNNEVLEYPVYEGDIRSRFPNISFPQKFEPPEEYIKVIDTAPPTISPLQDLVETFPVQVGAEWVRNWSVVEASQEEILYRTNYQWTNVRNQRNTLLQQSDWTQFNDCPLSVEEQQEWASYRQSLRDITLQEDPFNIVWPTEPQLI